MADGWGREEKDEWSELDGLVLCAFGCSGSNQRTRQDGRVWYNDLRQDSGYPDSMPPFNINDAERKRVCFFQGSG